MQAQKHVLLALTALAVSMGVARATATTMNITPSTVAVTYVKGTGPGAAQNVVVKPSAGSIYFTVDPNLPDWLMVSPTNGTPSSTSGTTVAFSASPFASSLGAGQYTATVTFHANTGTNTAPDQTVSVTLTVKNAAATIVPPGNVSISTWKPGMALPSASFVLQSTGDPVTFTLSEKYSNPSSAWFTLSPASYIAYSWGTTVTFSFVQAAFDNATIGKSLTGSITITPSNGTSAITVNVTVTVGAPTVTVTSVKPPKLPVVASGTNTRTVAVAGTNFADGMNVHVNSNAALTNNCSTFDAAKTEALCIQSSTLLYVKLTESSDLKNAGTVTINAGGASGQVTVTTAPIVYAVTDSASFVEPASGNASVSPYELISIFGDNFTSNTVYGSVSTSRYSNSLTDGAGHSIKVHFFQSDGSTDLANDPDAYLLLATPTQINLVVPSSIGSPAVGGTVFVVNYNSVLSDPVTLNVVAADPGFFTTNGGQGQAVAVLQDGSDNSTTDPGIQGSSAFLTFYLTGMGAPDSTGATTDSSTSCLSVANYLAAANTAYSTTWTTVDGAVIDNTLFGPHNLPPCLATAPTVSIGGVDFTSHVTYAGWVTGSVTGLYQMNVMLPASSLNGAVKVPATVAPAGSNSSNPYYVNVTVGGAASPSNSAYVYLK